MTTVLIILALLIGTFLYLGLIWRAPDTSEYDSPEPELMVPEHEISEEHEAVLAKLAEYHRQPRTTDIAAGRQRFEAMFGADIDIETRPVGVEGMEAEWVIAENSNPAQRLLYIHGGAFMVGSPRTHRFITSELAKRTGCSVLAIDYRKQPEFKTIHCHEDARKAYAWILENGPDGPAPTESLFVAGDSAGGNLTLAVIAWARDNGRQLANGAIALAPLTDFTMSSPTWQENVDTDYFLGPSIGRALKIPSFIRKVFGRISAGLPGNHPHLSPLFGNLDGLPPTLIQVSRHEMLYGDAKRYANKANKEGSRVTLQVWPKLVHVFQGFGNLPETHQAFDLMADFIRTQTPREDEQAA